MSESLIIEQDEIDKIINRERGYLGFGPEVARMSDLEILRKGVARTRRVMRKAFDQGRSASVTDQALTQFNRTQLAYNRVRMLGSGE